MLNSKNERELCYLVYVDDVSAMDADRLECAHVGGCESCRYRGFCWVDAIEPEEYLRFYALWAREHPEEANNE